MPVKAGDLDMFGLIAAAGHRSKHTAIVDNTAGDVHTVEACQDKERRGEKIFAEREIMMWQHFGNQVGPLVGLAPQEYESPQNHQAHKFLEPRQVAFLDCRERKYHPDTADDEQEGHERG